MRIAVWLDIHDWGGVDHHLRSMLANWSTEDDFVIFTNYQNPGFERVINFQNGDPRFRVVKYSIRPFAKSITRNIFEVGLLPIYLVWSTLRSKRLLSIYGPFDAFIGENGGYPGSWLTISALRASFKLGIEKRLLIVCHQAVSRLPLRQTVEQLIDRKVAKWSTRIVTISQATRQTMVDRRGFDLQKTSINVVFCSVSTDQETREFSFDLRRILDQPTDQVLVGILGRLDRYKGHDELVIAISQLPKDIRDKITLCIIGGSDEIRKSELLTIAGQFGVERNLRFLGYLEYPSPEIIAQLDVLVSATQDFEGFGLTIAEALAVGTPVIATDVGGVREFFNDDVGILVPPGDIDQLADALLHTLKDKEETAKRVKFGLLRAKELSEANMVANLRRELVR
jgi:glycosyltransferase involved in cell wall biosynthesis